MQDRNINGKPISPAGEKLTPRALLVRIFRVSILCALFSFALSSSALAQYIPPTTTTTSCGGSGTPAAPPPPPTTNPGGSTGDGGGGWSSGSGFGIGYYTSLIQGTQQSCPTAGVQCNAASGCGGGSGCIGDFFWALGSAESGDSYSRCNSIGCCGWIQFCKGNLTTAINTCSGSNYNFSVDSGQCQDQAILNYTQGNWNALLAAGASNYLCKTITISGVQYKITQAGLLGAANLCGPSGTIAWIAGGANTTDAYGTSCARYFLNFNSTYIPTGLSWADTTCPVQAPSCPGNSPTAPPPAPKPPPGPCGDPVFTGLFAQNPCGLSSPPAVKFPTYLRNWWNNSLLPALKDMTSQLYSYRIFETWELGRMMDALDVTRAARVQQELHLSAHQGVTPNQSTCVAGSFVKALTQTQMTATALTQGFIEDLERRAQGAVEKPTGTPSTYTPPGRNATYDISQRWTEYCNEFFDPQTNDAINACPGNPTTAPAGGVMNGDIDVESFLLQDTIDMNNPHNYAAAKAILINLIQPTIADRVPQNLINTTQGQEYIIRLQHLEAINNIAADVVGGIISRRAALPVTDTAIANKIDEIREAAGIPLCSSSPPAGTPCASATPSYNEIMKAMTQERFYDPRYFTRVQNNIGALKQEQASVDAYTTVQLQDIYQIQEQINALLAARAALKLQVQSNPNMSQSAPQ